MAVIRHHRDGDPRQVSRRGRRHDHYANTASVSCCDRPVTEVEVAEVSVPTRGTRLFCPNPPRSHDLSGGRSHARQQLSFRTVRKKPGHYRRISNGEKVSADTSGYCRTVSGFPFLYAPVAQPLCPLLLVGSDVRFSARHHLRRETSLRLGDAARHRPHRRIRQSEWLSRRRAGTWPGSSGWRPVGQPIVQPGRWRSSCGTCATTSLRPLTPSPTSCRSLPAGRLSEGDRRSSERRQGRRYSRAIPGKDSVASSWRASKTRGRASRAAPPPDRLPITLPDVSRPTLSTARPELLRVGRQVVVHRDRCRRGVTDGQ
jgi:hypothetical protein